jgi:hypothetical protein
MKLFEEFKTYENLWEDYEPTEVDKILWAMNDFEFEYDGFEVEDVEDRFDPGSWHGHYQVSKTYEHDDFTYKVDAMDVFEVLRDEILPTNKDKISDAGLQAEYKKLESAWENSTKETEEDTGEALDLFIAKNLEDLANDFYSELEAYFKDRAYDWANDNW